MPVAEGRYPQTNAHWNILGRPVNATQGNLAARTNATVFGVNAITDAAYGAGTGTSTSVPVPVEWGDVITKVSFLVGATAEATGTHAFAALYSGIATTPALIVQSTDVTGAAALAASARFDFTLTAPTLITQALAPYGYIYATICVTATTQPTLLCVTVAAGAGYQWFTNSPLYGPTAMTHGSAQGATAAATITSSTVHAATPLVFLT
jgi:hypothetical protein